MRKVVEEIVDMLVQYGIQIPEDKKPIIYSGIEVFGNFNEIERVINTLVAAESNIEKLKAIRMAFKLQQKLGTKA